MPPKRIDHRNLLKTNRNQYLSLRKNLSNFELGWLVGILEGEGCFYYLRSQAITMMSTDFDVVQTYAKLVAKIIGKDVFVKHTPRPRQNKDIFEARIHGDNARKVLHVIVSCMHQRRRARIWQCLNGHVQRKLTLAELGLDIRSIMKTKAQEPV